MEPVASGHTEGPALGPQESTTEDKGNEKNLVPKQEEPVLSPETVPVVESTVPKSTESAVPADVPVAPVSKESAGVETVPVPEVKTEKRELEIQEHEAKEAIEKLSGPIKDCTGVLLGLQKQRNGLFKTYLEELRALELRYNELYAPLYVQRKVALTEHNVLEGFWLKAMENNMMVKGAIFEKDEQLLKHLVDIRCIEESGSDNFVLEFEFSDNPFIEDKVLRKRFVHDADQDLEKAEGCEIHWKGENFTEKKIKKKKSKKGKTQMTVKTVPNPSFFSFFKTNTREDEHSEEEEEDDEAMPLSMLEDDEDLGVEIRDEIIPCAVLFYLGVRQKEDMEGMELDEEDEDEDDEDEKPAGSKPPRKKSKGGEKDKKVVDASGKSKEECKNQ